MNFTQNIFQDEDDERMAQALRDFDSFFEELVAFCEANTREFPPVLQAEINHKCYTHFNKDKDTDEISAEDLENAKRMDTNKFVEHLLETDNVSVLSVKRFRDVEGNLVYNTLYIISHSKGVFLKSNLIFN